MRLLRHAALLLFCLSAAGLSHAACESGLAERMHAKLHPKRPLDERLAACKIWPAFPGRSIVVLPLPRETTDNGAKVFDLELLLIQRPDNGNTERDAGHARLFQPEALDEDATTSGSRTSASTPRATCCRPTPAPSACACATGAPAPPAARWRARPCACTCTTASSFARCCRRSSSTTTTGDQDSTCTGRFEKLRTMLSVGKASSNGFADLQLSRTLVQSRAQEEEDQGCVEKALPAKFSTVTLRYDGERFEVPKSLLRRAP